MDCEGDITGTSWIRERKREKEARLGRCQKRGISRGMTDRGKRESINQPTSYSTVDRRRGGEERRGIGILRMSESSAERNVTAGVRCSLLASHHTIPCYSTPRHLSSSMMRTCFVFFCFTLFCSALLCPYLRIRTACRFRCFMRANYFSYSCYLLLLSLMQPDLT